MLARIRPLNLVVLVLLLLLALAGCAQRPPTPDAAVGTPGPSDPSQRPGTLQSGDGSATEAPPAAPGPEGPWAVDVRGNATFVGRMHVPTRGFDCEVRARTVTTLDAWARHLHILEVYEEDTLVGIFAWIIVAGRVFDVQAGPASTGDPYDQYVAPVVAQVSEGPGVSILDTTYGLSSNGQGQANMSLVHTVVGQGLTRESAGQGGEPVRMAARCTGAEAAWEGTRDFVAWLPGDGGGPVNGRGLGAAGAVEVLSGPALEVAGRARLLGLSSDGLAVADVRTPEGTTPWVFPPDLVAVEHLEGGPGPYAVTATGAHLGGLAIVLADLHPIDSPLDMYDPISGK